MADKTRVLLVEDNPGDVRLLRERLAEVTFTKFELTHREQLGEALQCLAAEQFDVALLDLSLPDSQGFETFARIHDQSPQVPVVVLTGAGDETLAFKMVHEGAQDYLTKGEVTGNLLARSIRYATERARLLNEVQRLAITDELTGTYNRRHFFELAEREYKRVRRFSRALSAIMLDIDHFKRVNDTFGHPVGDQVLRVVADRCQQGIRAIDILGRYGGEEFVVLLPETDLPTAQKIAERLRQSVAQTPVGTERGALDITISLGVTSASEPVADLATLLERADAAMYRAKEAGRNRVEVR